MNTRVHEAVATTTAPSAWPHRNAGQVHTAVLTIAGMPRKLRPAVERAMARCITTESEFIVPGDDPLTAQWCTRWYRDMPGDAELVRAVVPARVGIGCRQVITGTQKELAALEREVELLSTEHAFSARVDVTI
ncbi:hypothetical protein QP414_11765 [Corynebacterium simulans]|uniref:Secreted protein n=1 Tax=Corynebacterium simulans TaxID=146827 RepID=A0ABR5V8B8_9CORY|nr:MULTISPECIES: hypothetical protein [Corynebacterium]AMO92440.1 putative secreted protein [Corynebacterium simulans]KXU17657.1 putative secreted protein [Corynebacterium simulans]MDK7139969.1 hypothetical protein [Corynebacterium simulans]OFR39439.1 hypothetical protein HMPREF2888_08345 [Corynebacterium sp. HMSC077D03]